MEVLTPVMSGERKPSDQVDAEIFRILGYSVADITCYIQHQRRPSARGATPLDPDG